MACPNTHRGRALPVTTRRADGRVCSAIPRTSPLPMTAKQPVLQPDPEYLKAFATIMSRIESGLGRKNFAKPIVACVAGGAALHFYTGSRISRDIDARVMARVLLDPRDLQVAYRDHEGHARMLYFDMQYNDTFALLHQSAYDDALAVPLEGVDAQRLLVKLLTPLDLAVSKR